MRHAFLTAALTTLLLTGCDKPAEKSAQEMPAATPAPVAEPPVSTTPTPTPLTTPATPAPLTPTPAANSAATTPAHSPTPTANLTAADLQPQLDQAMQYIKDHKYDLAEKALNTLDQQKSSWPTSVQTAINPKLDSLRQALTAAKGGSSALDALKGFTSSPSNTPNNVK